MNISDPTGQLAGIALFAREEKDLANARAVLEQTDKVIAVLEGRFNEGQFDPTIRSVSPMEATVADAGSLGLRVFVDEPAAVTSVATLLERATREAKSRARGPVQLCLMAPDLPGHIREVEIALGENFHVNPQIKGAIKSLGGVVTVEDV